MTLIPHACKTKGLMPKATGSKPSLNNTMLVFQNSFTIFKLFVFFIVKKRAEPKTQKSNIITMLLLISK